MAKLEDFTFRAPLTVRLEVEGMRHQIVRQVAEHQLEIEQAIQNCVDTELAQFDFGREVAKAVDQLLPESIRTAVERAVRDAVHRGALYEIVQEAVRDAARKVADGDV